MSNMEVPINAISRYLPLGTDSAVLSYLNRYHVQLTVTRKRKSVLGNYTYKPQSGHHIRINGDLNPYAFLITLLHELAHLVAFQSFGARIQPHGKEWKNCFSSLLDVFIFQKIFPSDIEHALLQSIKSPTTALVSSSAKPTLPPAAAGSRARTSRRAASPAVEYDLIRLLYGAITYQTSLA